MRKQNFIRSFIVLLVFMTIFTGLAYAEGQNQYTENGQPVGPGTYYRNMVYDTENGRFVINMLEANAGAPYIRFETSDSGDKIGNQTVSKQALAKSSKDTRVIGAINGDFFYTSIVKGLPSGTSIVDGTIKTAIPECSIFGITDSGNCFIDKLTMNGAVTYKEESYKLEAVNRPRWNNQLIVYTGAYGAATGTTNAGTEVIVTGLKLPLKANQTYTGTVYKVFTNSKNTEIPADGIVLSGQGTAAEFLKKAAEGESITFNINFSRPNIRYAAAGNPRLIENGKVSTDIENRLDAKTRHPRTAIGIKGGKVYMITVDGRRPGTSDGMNLYEFTEFLLGQGIENAINLDGGGSTAMVVRKQGYALPKVVNTPSDGRERAVSNSIQIVSAAPLAPPAYIRFGDEDVQVYKNSSYKPSFYVMDKYYNLLTVDSKNIKYTTNTKAAKTAKDGTFTAGTKVGKSYMDVQIGSLRGRLPITVVDTVASLKINNDFILLDPGQKIQLNLKAYDQNGKTIFISPSAVKWTVTWGVGKVDAKGVFTAGNNKNLGLISVKIGNVEAKVGVNIGKVPMLIADFEKLDNIEIQNIRSEASIKISSQEEPKKTGKTSLHLDYNFLQTETGTAASYINFKEPLKVLGKPTEIGFWVYGDGSSHWIRGSYINAKGAKKVIDFTKEGGLDFKGWKYVYGEIPKTEAFPIAIDQIYIAEPKQERKNAGTLYIDDLTVQYKYEKDIYSPEVLESSLKNGAVLEAFPAEITMTVYDKGAGIDGKSLNLRLNGETVLFNYDEKTGKISYIPTDEPTLGEYILTLMLGDKAGNILNPEYTIKFNIYKAQESPNNEGSDSSNADNQNNTNNQDNTDTVITQ